MEAPSSLTLKPGGLIFVKQEGSEDGVRESDFERCHFSVEVVSFVNLIHVSFEVVAYASQEKRSYCDRRGWGGGVSLTRRHWI